MDHERIRATQAEEHVRILQETIRVLRADAQRERERLRPLLERCLAILGDHGSWEENGVEVFPGGEKPNALAAALRAELGKERAMAPAAMDLLKIGREIGAEAERLRWKMRLDLLVGSMRDHGNRQGAIDLEEAVEELAAPPRKKV